MSTSTKPPAMPTTSIVDLPPEMIIELFKYLRLNDLVACSMVNKRWHSIYTSFKMHRLVATNRYSAIRKWKGSSEVIRENERCLPKTFVRLIEKPLISNLKHLALVGHFAEFDFNKLNRFRQLLQLEISITLFCNPVRARLSLPQLKVLAFNCLNKRCALSIDCPLLSTLVYYYNETENEGPLEVKHPETIRRLETNWFGSKASLVPFKNVESLVTDELEVINKATLLLLPRLRELHWDKHIDGAFDQDGLDNENGTKDRLKRTLSEFLAEAKKLRGSDFQFRFSGFQLAKLDFDQIDLGLQVDKWVWNEYVYLKNYHLIEPGALHFINEIDYERLLSNLSGEIPRCFARKFTDVRTVWVNHEVQDEPQLLLFLKSLRSLGELMQNTTLSQEFYDQLPASAPSLDTLFLTDHSENELQLNFDFISQLFCLSELYTFQPLSSESVHSLVRRLGKIASCEVHVRLRAGGPKKEECVCSQKDEDSKWERLEIWKNERSTEWEVIKDNTLILETEKPEKMANFIKGFVGGGYFPKQMIKNFD